MQELVLQLSFWTMRAGKQLSGEDGGLLWDPTCRGRKNTPSQN